MKNAIDKKLPESLKKDLDKAIEILKEMGCNEIYVFGSIASGNFNADSDIDLAVKGLPKEVFFKTGGRLMFELSRKFDLVDLDAADSRFSGHIMKKGDLIRVA